MSETDEKEIRRLRRADPRLAAAVDKRYAHWSSGRRALMLLAIAKKERELEEGFKGVEDAE